MNVFLTGSGSGFGFLLTRRLLELGHTVVATDQHVSGLEQRLLHGLGPDCAARLEVHELDVREDEHVQALADRVCVRGPVDLLVNDAGVAVFGSLEETDLDRVRNLFAVNVFGVAAVTRAFLPSLRQSAGTVVMLSSVAGRVVFPESGFYAASKYAVEALSEALVQEAGTFGVKVRVIEPGAYATRFYDHAEALSPPRDDDSAYAHLRPLWDQRRSEVLEDPQDPAEVVAAIVASLDDPRPLVHVPVGADADRLLRLRDSLSGDAWSRLAADRNGLEGPPHQSGEVLDPAEVIALWGARPLTGEWTDTERRRLVPTVMALRTHHLDHWVKSELGRRALMLLS